MATTNPQQPRLYHDLCSALNSLYGSSNHGTCSHEAHEFLMHVQGRNVRRKLQSIQQSQKDAKEPLKEADVLAEELNGSTWWACIALLLTPDAPSTIKLFCAQTLLHRIRRFKLVEAIDLELEVSSMQEYYQYIMQQRPELSLATMMQIHDEHVSKGQSMLSTIAWIMIEQAQQQTHLDQALLSTLAATIAVIALRLRFTPQSLTTTPEGPTMCDMVLHSLNSVRGTNSATLFLVSCIALGAIPDTILGNPGGARGKLSVDPRCIQAAKDELVHSGIPCLWTTLQRQDILASEAHTNSMIVLITCEQWAKCLPLPLEFIQYTVPLAKEYLLLTPLHHTHERTAALAYLIALYESGSWTVEKILAFSLGLTADQLPQASAKKKQSSKSKKRHKERLQDGTTDTSQQQAEMECRHRGDMTLQTTFIVWEALDSAAQHSLQQEEAEGEGPVVCLTACANTCLPHLVKYGGGEPNGIQLMLSIMNTFQLVCSHPNRNVRGLTYEPLFSLHKALLETSDGQQMTEVESLVADHFYKCCLRLATGCGYPSDYFQYLTDNNDDELENERDDVRGVLRALSGSGEDNYVTPTLASTQILHRLIRACSEEIFNHTTGLPPENVVHALSALAKPVNHLVEAYMKNEAPSNATETIGMILTALRFTGNRINTLFASLPANECIAVSRLVAMATSSYAPSFVMIHRKATITPTETDRELLDLLQQTLRSTMKTAFLSVVHIPELVSESTLHQTQFDIRGAMRGPGGEDHVGVLVFMRLADESDDMAKLITHVGCNEHSSILVDLCQLHDQLKEKEKQRSPGIVHGIGVTPKSRRILLSTISKLVRLSDSQDKDHAQHMLHNLLYTAVSSIVGAKPHLSSLDALTMYQLTEATFDLAAFGTATVPGLFAPLLGDADDQTRQECIHVLVQTGTYGYKLNSVVHSETTIDVLQQWGRFRAAVVSLMKTMAFPDLSPLGAMAVTAWITAECDAITTQCAAGPGVLSPIFVEGIISEEICHAGAFVKILGTMVVSARDGTSPQLGLHNVVNVMQQICSPVLHVLLHPCPEWTQALVVDPRPCLGEAWFMTMNSLVTVLPRLEPSLQSTVGQLVVDSCSAATLLMLSPTLNDDEQRSCMSMDGYHTLAMLEFLHGSYSLGSEILNAVAFQVKSQITGDGDGIAMIGASLFRATSGGLPPWVVDHIPQVFEGLFVAHHQSLDAFQLFLERSMSVCSSTSLLSSRFIGAMSNESRSTFLTTAMIEISQGNWRRFKVILKKACGGKKKHAGFNLKPSPTNWECDRV